MIRGLLSFLSLFTALSTLFCCALPALFVVVGAGATFAGLTRSVPQLIWVAEHKDWVFALGGLCLTAGFMLPKLVPPPDVCAVDEAEAGTACETTKDWTQPLLKVAIVLYSIGFVFAYVLPLIM